VPGQCTTCHNGHIAAGKPNSHSSGVKATKSCDSCHRTFIWLPASWNHVGVTPGTCAALCHNGTAATGKPTGNHASGGRSTYACDSCHNYFGWAPNTYSHTDSNYNAVGGACESCHSFTSGINYTPVNTSISSHNGVTSGCSNCHVSKVTWLGALGAAPANHAAFSGVTCASCHTSSTSTHVTGSTLHVGKILGACYTCHGTSRTYTFANVTTASWPNYHESSKNPSATDCSASGCHAPSPGTKGTAYTSWD